MVYTVTLNPSLDYNAKAVSANTGKTNRTYGEFIVPGGKGLNVSIMLSKLGVSTTAFGFSAGFTGEELKRLMKEQGCNSDFITLANGFTRINVKLISDTITEFNGSGATISATDIDNLKSKISTLSSNDTLVLSGSIPKGVDEDIYLVLASAAPKGTQIIIDTCGVPLSRSLAISPFLIKPNIDELCDLFNRSIESREDIVKSSKTLQNMGAQNVLVSLGEKGAILVTADGKEYYCDAPVGSFVNTVGAGDSMVAGFIAEYKKSKNEGKALKFAVACGSATAYSPWLADTDTINKLYEMM